MRLPGYKIDKKTQAAIGVTEPGRNGWARSCSAGHGKIIYEAKRLGLKNIIIFEDDALFYDNVQDVIGPIVNDLRNEPWDIFYLSCQIATDAEKAAAKRMTKNLYRLHHGCWGAYAYAINHTMYDVYLMEDSTHGWSHLKQPYLPSKSEHIKVLHDAPDLFFKHQCTYNILTGNYPIAYTYDDISDVNFGQLAQRGLKIGNENVYRDLFRS